MIVLRFSDYERPTIQEHLDILERTRADDTPAYVWWGWWKKNHERFPAATLGSLAERIQRDGSVEIGLIERATQQFIRATCIKVVTDQGHAIPAPDVELAPRYYSASPFPAWFAFSSLEKISDVEWKHDFGRIPSGDETLYEAQRPRPVVDSCVVDAEVDGDREGILHLSDLHFGGDHGYTVHPGHVTTVTTLLDRIENGLPGSPACVVVSGDLTTRGDPIGLVSGRLFIQELAARLGLPRQAVVVAPGNHDILIEDPEVTRDFRNEQLFRDQMQLFYGVETPNERVHDIRDASGRHYVIGVLNSSRPRRKETMDYGYVGSDRSAPVFRTIKAVSARPRGAVWSAVVMHHHVLSAPIVEEPERGRPVSLALDAGELVSLAQRHGVSAILHGHQHLPFVGEVRRWAEFTTEGPQTGNWAKVCVLGAGSAGAAQMGERIPQEIAANSLSYYRPFAEGGLDVTCVSYLPHRAPQTVWHFRI